MLRRAMPENRRVPEAPMGMPGEHGAQAEIKPQERVFLTPRVIDEAALHEIAGALRGLIDDAASRERSLREAGAEVADVEARLAETVKSLRESLEAAARTTPAPPSAVSPGPSGATTEAEARLHAARAAVESAADDAVIRVAALARQVEAAGNDARTVLEELAAAEASARRTCIDLGAALAEGDRRAQTLATGVEAVLADAARRAPATAPTATGAGDLEGRIAEAKRVGDALARIVAHADAVGRALAGLADSRER